MSANELQFLSFLSPLFPFSPPFFSRRGWLVICPTWALVLYKRACREVYRGIGRERGRERVRLFGLLMIKKGFDTHASARACKSGINKGRALFSLFFCDRNTET